MWGIWQIEIRSSRKISVGIVTGLVVGLIQIASYSLKTAIVSRRGLLNLTAAKQYKIILRYSLLVLDIEAASSKNNVALT